MVNLEELKNRLNKILQKAINSDKVQARVGSVYYTDTAITMNIEFRKGNLNEIGQLNFEKYCDMLPPQKESYNTANRFILDGEVYYKFKGKKNPNKTKFYSESEIKDMIENMIDLYG